MTETDRVTLKKKIKNNKEGRFADAFQCGRKVYSIIMQEGYLSLSCLIRPPVKRHVTL